VSVLHALAVNGRGDHLCPIQAKALDGGQKGGAFHNHLVAGVDEGFAQQVQRLLAAGGDDQPVGLQALDALAGHEGGQLFAQRVVALGGAVLQRGAGLFSQRLVGGLLNAGHVKHGAVRKTPGKADDAGLAQQLEQLADGGGFDVVQAVGELEGHGVNALRDGGVGFAFSRRWGAGFLRYSGGAMPAA
jgi:hypothetical protein